MIKFNKENTALKVIALLIALLLWFYINADGSTPIKKSIDLDLNYENLAEDLIVTNGIKEVRIKVKADDRLISDLNMRDFHASVNLKDAELGDQEVVVDVQGPRGIEIIDVSPSMVKLNIDKVAEKQVPVNVSLLGNTEEGYSNFKSTVNPSHVVIKGPKTLIDTIVDARVDVNLNNSKSSLLLNLPIKARDTEDKTYGSEVLTMNPSNVEVFVPIIKDAPSKLVPIKHVLEGTSEEGYKVGRVIVEPATIEIIGTDEVLEDINYIETEPINIKGIRGNITREARLVLPSGVSLVYNTKVKVMIQIEDNVVKRVIKRDIKVLNLDDDKKVRLTPTSGNITVEGNRNVLDNLAAKDLELFVDLRGLDLGNHEIALQSSAGANLKTLEVEPNKIKVEITESGNQPQEE